MEMKMGDEVPSAWNSELAEASWLIVPLYNEGQVIRSVMQEARRTFPNIVCVWMMEVVTTLRRRHWPRVSMWCSIPSTWGRERRCEPVWTMRLHRPAPGIS